MPYICRTRATLRELSVKYLILLALPRALPRPNKVNSLAIRLAANVSRTFPLRVANYPLSTVRNRYLVGTVTKEDEAWQRCLCGDLTRIPAPASTLPKAR